MATKRIAVVGAGPKAVAIAAKADVLNRVRGTDLRITVFEKSDVGANWSGDFGYTDGEARLCTPAERDLGFPYDVGVADPEIAAAMYGEYSWGAYLIAQGRSDARSGFNNWTNRGRLAPTHAEFAGYLRWAMKRSGATVEIATAKRLERMRNGWRVHRTSAAGKRVAAGRFDGIVFTGPGPPQRRLLREGQSSRIADGYTFWRDPDAYLRQAGGIDEPLIILGAGGTAAAIAARAIREKVVSEVVVIGDQAALFTRVEAFFESQIFTDAAVWKRLDQSTRREFTDRLNRGVVWASISNELARSPKVRFEPGRGRKISVRSPIPGLEEIAVEYERGGETFRATGSLTIDACGFDPWWFVPMLPASLRDRLTGASPEEEKSIRQAVEGGMTPYLELFSEGPGPIHAPMLSQSVGPGLSSLMALGAMSDLIISRYLELYVAP